MTSTASPDSMAPLSARAELTATARKDLAALRAELDARYATLETALLDPDRRDGLETLVLDLARAATDEAEAATCRMWLALQIEAERQSAEARTGVEELAAARQAMTAHTAELEELRRQLRESAATVAALRRELDALRAGLDLTPAPSDEADAASLLGPVDRPDRAPADVASGRPIATRYTFPRAVDIQIGGDPATLIELSVRGAQVISSTPLKPNHLVRMLVPLGEAAVGYKGRVVWARLEPTRGHQAGLLCRAEIEFTRVESAAIEAALIHHAAIAMNE